MAGRALAPPSFAIDRARRVLVLQGRLAVWTLWRRGRRAAVHVERLDDETAACTCPWPAVSETLVDVVADSPLDDVERVLADGSERASGAPPPAPGRLSRRRLRRRLARLHPAAELRSAPPQAMPLLGALLTAELPDDWRRRLDALQRGAVTITALHSAIGLHRPAADERVGDVLLVLPGGGVERHLLLRSGCPTFTRVVATGDSAAESRAALDETLAHLAARHGVVAPREHRRSGFPSAADAAIERSGASVPTHAIENACRLAALAIAAGRRASRNNRSALLDKRRRRTELRRLHVATTLTAAIAASTVLASAVHGIDSARRRARAVAAEEALALRVDRLAEAVAERHPTPGLADASLALLERQASVGAPAAEAVLALLAEALTAHPALRLDRLEWSTPEGADASLDERVDAANQPLRRLRRADDVDAPAVALLELGGRVDAAGALSVRERQRRFEAFVATLERNAGVSGLRVRLSPAGAATSRDDGTGAAPTTDYALQLRYAERR